jgi:hypothetical protein
MDRGLLSTRGTRRNSGSTLLVVGTREAIRWNRTCFFKQQTVPDGLL